MSFTCCPAGGSILLPNHSCICCIGTAVNCKWLPSTKVNHFPVYSRFYTLLVVAGRSVQYSEWSAGCVKGRALCQTRTHTPSHTLAVGSGGESRSYQSGDLGSCQETNQKISWWINWQSQTVATAIWIDPWLTGWYMTSSELFFWRSEQILNVSRRAVL